MAITEKGNPGRVRTWQRYPAYKPSGVEWLGEVPADWKITKIKKIAATDSKSFIDGDWIETPFIVDEGIRLIQTGNIGIGKYKEQGFRFISEESFTLLGCTEVKTDDILICRLADPVGRACLAPPIKKMITSVDNVILKVRNDINPKYIVYFLSTDRYLLYLTSISRGSTRDRISRTNLGDIHICLPPIEEQSIIADFLERETTRIDALIEKKERQIELLQEKRAALISHVVTKGLDPTVKMKDSGVEWLGMVPEGWQITKFPYIIDFQEGPGIMAEDFQDYGIPLLRICNIQNKWVNLEGCNFLSEEKIRSKWAHYRLKENDLLISSSASMGIVSEVTKDAKGAIAYTGIIRLRPKVGLTLKNYIKWIVGSQLFFTQIDLFKTGSTIQHFGPYHLRQMIIVIPPLPQQTSILAFLDCETVKIDALIQKISDSIVLLGEYRSALISAAVTGKIDVRQEAKA